MKLEAICSHLVLEVSGPVLGHAGHLPAQLVLVMVLHALIYEGSADGNRGLDFSKFMLNCLQICNTAPKCLSLLDPFPSGLKQGLTVGYGSYSYQ